MKNLKREIFDTVNERTEGHLITADESLDANADRIAEALQTDLAAKLEKVTEDRDEWKDEAKRLSDIITAFRAELLNARGEDFPVAVSKKLFQILEG